MTISEHRDPCEPCETSSFANFDDFEIIKTLDDFMTCIDFLLNKKGVRVARKCVKDEDCGVPLVILCEIANYKLYNKYGLHSIAPKFYGYDLSSQCIYLEAAAMDLRGMTYALRGEDHVRMHYLDHVMKSTVLCLAACHSLGLVHSDPKPQNYLVYTHNFVDPHNLPRITLCDFGYTSNFGLARYNDDYRPPETWKNKKASIKADIWALGLTLLHYIFAETIVICPKDGQSSKRLTCQVDWDPASFMKETLEEIYYPLCVLDGISDDDEIMFNEDEIKRYDGIIDAIFKMVRYNPEERRLPHYPEMDKFPKVIHKPKNEKEFANSLLLRSKLNIEMRLKAAAEAITTKWFHGNGHINYDEISKKYNTSFKEIEEAEKQIIIALDGLIYLPEFIDSI